MALNTTCQIQGNGDIYGLGVRIGIYLQWMTSILTENVHQAEIPATRAAGDCYQVAMLAGLIRVSQYPQDHVLALEGYIVLILCFAGVWATSFGLQGLGSKKKTPQNQRGGDGEEANGETSRTTPTPTPSTLLSIVLSATICGYGTWFLFTGMSGMKRTRPDCSEVVFFFAPVKLFGWVLIILKVFFIASLAGSTLLLVYRGYDAAQNLGTLAGEWKLAPTTGGRRRASEATQEERGHVEVRVVMTVGSVLSLVLFVVSIELTLRWNHVVGVYSCANFSQVFPFAVGASNIVKVGWGLAKRLAKRDLEVSVGW